MRVGILGAGRVPTHWYTGTPNFGDQMSPDLVSWVAGRPAAWVSQRYPGKLLAVGSILGALARGDTVWGAGLIRDEQLIPPPGVRFLAVRGPLTRSLIDAEVPEIYGDPALLLPHFHTSPVQQIRPIGIVPHYVDQAEVNVDDTAIKVIDVRKPWRTVVDAIRSCEAVLSSSLHGLIVAEAYGIPASWIKITDGVVGGGFKFNDYYLASGRGMTQPSPWEQGIDAALNRTAPPLVYDPQPLLAAAQSLRVPDR